MEGLIEELHELMEKDIAEMILDAAIIAELQRIEHYEISVYGTLATFAKLLDREAECDVLGQTLDEEKEADESLTDIAENTINPEAKQGEEMVEESHTARKSKSHW